MVTTKSERVVFVVFLIASIVLSFFVIDDIGDFGLGCKIKVMFSEEGKYCYHKLYDGDYQNLSGSPTYFGWELRDENEKHNKQFEWRETI